MKMLVLACLGVTAAAIPFQQSTSVEAKASAALAELGAVLAQEEQHDVLLETYAAAQAGYRPAHSAYQRAAKAEQRAARDRARQVELEDQIAALRREWHEIERRRDLLDTRAELETLASREEMRLSRRERLLALEAKAHDLEAEAHAVSQQELELIAELADHHAVELASMEAEHEQRIEVRRAETFDRLMTERAEGEDQLEGLFILLEAAEAEDDHKKARGLMRTVAALEAKLGHEMEQRERAVEFRAERARTMFETVRRQAQSRVEREIQRQHEQIEAHAREVEIQRRGLGREREEIEEQFGFDEERLVLERELVQREREIVMETEMAHMASVIVRLERELERATEQSMVETDERDAYEAARRQHEEAAGSTESDGRIEMVLEAIDGLRSDVNVLRRDVDKLMKRAESLR